MRHSFDVMPISALIGLAFGVAILSIGLYHTTFVAPKIRQLTSVPESAGDAGDAPAPAALCAPQTLFEKKAEERLDRLERAHKRDSYRIGFIRYNAFADVGSDQSFTLALVNDAGDGVVLTSLYSREDTRTYGKAVRKFATQQDASKEEHSAIAMARTGVGV